MILYYHYAAICSTAAADRAATNGESTPKNRISGLIGMDSRQVASLHSHNASHNNTIVIYTLLSYSISAKNMATAAANESGVELAPTAMDIHVEAPIQATSDAEPIMVVVTPKRDFYKAKVVYVQPVQETTPSRK